MTDERRSGLPLILSGIHGERVELTVRGYQCPDVLDGYDANWLTIDASFRNELGAWTRSASCLLTWELHWLRRWLPAVVEGVAADDTLGFLEPDLCFQFVGRTAQRHCFVVKADHGLSYAEAGGSPCLFMTRLGDDDLADALVVVDDWLRAFPVRGTQGHHSLASLPGPRLLLR